MASSSRSSRSSSSSSSSSTTPGASCVLVYRSSNSTDSTSAAAAAAAGSDMPLRADMPDFQEWKRRREMRNFGDSVVLLELDPKEELARKRIRDQRLLDMMTEQQQAKYYSYLDQQERTVEKVEQQRQQREQQQQQRQQQQQEQQRKKKEENRIRKKLQRVQLQTDSKFVSEIPKSKYYRLIQQEQSQQLKHRSDIDEFWQRRLQSEGLLRPAAASAAAAAAAAAPEWTPYRRTSAAASQSREGAAGEDQDEQQDADRFTTDAFQLGRIEEAPSEATTTRSRGGSTKSFHQLTRAQQARFIEEKFPRVEYPKLNSFEVDYSKKEERSPEQLELEFLAERRKIRLAEMKQHRHMQQMAVTFTAMTRRIFDERPIRDSAEFIGQIEEGGRLSPLFGATLAQAQQRQQQQQQQQHSGSGSSPSAGRGGELSITDHRLLQSWRKLPSGFRKQQQQQLQLRQRSAEISDMTATSASRIDRPITTPASPLEFTSAPVNALSLTAAEQQHRIVQPRQHTSTIWNNYLAAGKVKFAPLDDDEWFRNAKQTVTAAAY